jgi:hypothetical protein
MTDGRMPASTRRGDERRRYHVMRTRDAEAPGPRFRGTRRQHTALALPLGWLAFSDQHLRGVPATCLPQHHCDSVAIPATAAPFTCSSRWSTPQRSGDLSLLCCDACPPVQSHQIANKTRDEQASHGLVWNVLSFPRFKAQMPGLPGGFGRAPRLIAMGERFRTKRSRSPLSP